MAFQAPLSNTIAKVSLVPRARALLAEIDSMEAGVALRNTVLKYIEDRSGSGKKVCAAFIAGALICRKCCVSDVLRGEESSLPFCSNHSESSHSIVQELEKGKEKASVWGIQ